MLLNCEVGEDSWEYLGQQGDQTSESWRKFWIFIGRIDTEATILWPPDVNSWRIGKDPDVGKDCGQEEKGVREDEMFGWHHRLNGHEFEQAKGNSERQGSLVCCSPWSPKALDMTEWLKNNKIRYLVEFSWVAIYQIFFQHWWLPWWLRW